MDVNCPHCGTIQEQSSRVLSAVCRYCGESFKVKSASHRGGLFRLSALFGLRKPERGYYLKPSIELSDEPRERPAVREARFEPFEGDDEYDPAAGPGIESGSVDAPDAAALGAELDGLEDDDDEMGSGYEMIEVGATRTWTGSVEHPARRSLNASFSERTTTCFDCGMVLRFSDEAKAVTCSRCSAQISLENLDIRDHWREPIKIRGDLTIHRKASVSAMEIACDTLRVYGMITGKIDCHGDAFFRSSGKVVGSVSCRHLFVHKTSELIFIPGIRAETAEIHGRITGDLICEGTVRITKTGVVMGDCTAPAVQLDSGGILSGQMRIAKPDAAMREDYERKAAVARSEFLEHGMEDFEKSAREGAGGGAGDELPSERRRREEFD